MYEQHDAPQGNGVSVDVAEGASVYDSEGERIGTLYSMDPTSGALTVRHGHVFGHEYTVPREAVARADAEGVHLNVRRADLKSMEHGNAAAAAADARVDTAVGPGRTPAAPSVIETAQQARDSIGAAVTAAGGAVQAVQATAGQAAQAAQQAAGETMDAARREAEGAKGVVRDKAAETMAQASDGLSGAAAAVGQVSAGLRSVDHGMLSQYTDRAAQQLEDLAGRLREMTPEQALHEVEQLAKRQPALFMAAAFAVGLLGARVLHSAAAHGETQGEKKTS